MARGNGGTEKLVNESERLRQQLLRMAARLEVFSDELLAEAQVLKDEAVPTPEGNDHERGDDTA